ncbi:MAG TPA: hypothetical protein VK760_05685, partial [Candidatus Acidoferrales bacterium]|nr:hypothetical protein [Candidatus Acidoferrales bacterium]
MTRDTRRGLAAVPDLAGTGEAAVRAALRYRIALIVAPAGWGKTFAARAALDGAAHRWIDLSLPGAAFDPQTWACGGGVVALDGVHRLSEAERSALVDCMHTLPGTRWLL